MSRLRLAVRWGTPLAGARALDQPVPLIFRSVLGKETTGSPKFPSYPCECMPRSQTPVVSSDTRHFASQDCCLPTHRRRRLSSTLGWTYPSDHNHYLFRGSITQPAPLLSPAPDSPYGVCLWALLLACRLNFGQVGLFRTIRNHPLGNIIKFHPGFPGIPTTRISLGTTMFRLNHKFEFRSDRSSYLTKYQDIFIAKSLRFPFSCCALLISAL